MLRPFVKAGPYWQLLPHRVAKIASPYAPIIILIHNNIETLKELVMNTHVVFGNDVTPIAYSSNTSMMRVLIDIYNDEALRTKFRRNLSGVITPRDSYDFPLTTHRDGGVRLAAHFKEVEGHAMPVKIIDNMGNTALPIKLPDTTIITDDYLIDAMPQVLGEFQRYFDSFRH